MRWDFNSDATYGFAIRVDMRPATSPTTVPGLVIAVSWDEARSSLTAQAVQAVPDQAASNVYTANRQSSQSVRI